LARKRVAREESGIIREIEERGNWAEEKLVRRSWARRLE
jgi:hypothetical protein